MRRRSWEHEDTLRPFALASVVTVAASVAALASAWVARAEPSPPHPVDCAPPAGAGAVAAADAPGATLAARIDSVLPTADEDRFMSVPWRTNLMAARREAQEHGKPIFLWIMVGNPQGCT